MGNAETKAGFTARDEYAFQVQNNQKDQPQSNYYGRKLEYPHSKPTNVRPSTTEKPSQKRSQSADFGSKHFTDRTVKSKKIADDKASFE